MRPMILLLPFVLLGLLVACTAAVSESPAGPTPETRPDEPLADQPLGVPIATLSRADGEGQRAFIGTHCWNLGAGAIECFEASGPFAPLEPLRVAPGDALTFALPDALSSVSLRVAPWVPETGDAPEGLIPVASADEITATPLEPAMPLPWQAPTEPGEYLVDLFTLYDTGGDIQYRWHLLVE